MLAVTNMDTVELQFLEELFSKNYTYERISEELKNRYPGVRGFSVTSIKLYCKKNGISRRVNQQFINQVVTEAVQEVRDQLLSLFIYQ